MVPPPQALLAFPIILTLGRRIFFDTSCLHHSMVSCSRHRALTAQPNFCDPIGVTGVLVSMSFIALVFMISGLACEGNLGGPSNTFQEICSLRHKVIFFEVRQEGGIPITFEEEVVLECPPTFI